MNALTAAESGPSPTKKALSSVAALLVGWAAGELFALLCEIFSGELSLEWLAMGLFVLLFATPVWLIVMLPAALTIRASSPLWGAKFAPFIGAAIGAFALSIEFWILEIPQSAHLYLLNAPWGLHAQAAVIGACAWSYCAWLLRSSASAHSLGIAPRM